MITRLQGTVVECDLTEIVLDVHGIGYAVAVPMSTYDKLPALGGDMLLHTHLAVREDAMQLFGFATLEERKLFRLLISVSGIGPRLALNALSCMPVSSFCKTVVDGDLKLLSRINGIGKRTAERLVVELREKVAQLSPEASLGAASGCAKLNVAAHDAIAALATLGYKEDKACKTVQDLCAELAVAEQSAENLIRKALQRLNG